MHLTFAECQRLGIDWDTGRLAEPRVLHPDPPVSQPATDPMPADGILGAMTIVLPGHPPTLNQLTRGTLRERMRMGKGFDALVASNWWGPSAKAMRRVHLKIVLGHRQRGADPDAFWKGLLDALVNAGALVNDSKEWVELMPVQYERGPRAMSVIRLEDVNQ